ncbi:MAG: deoxyguanosinetriphosphate triphosphohydrolase [Candidatus Pelagibacter sp. TMED153]|nr:MAG: deoxyguanosinetriphosphate triphosphohydrolase [Candidatus Pelagibacter sp. TMED153]|tara:strand:- start:405 stop:1535 length:1131 start_codon:yes stop_codon:yes gene_type:complete
MQKNNFFELSTSIKSKGRFNVEKKSDLRSPYQRDRDRIVHSTAFRRLKHKTQVFVNTSDDHYRTRITHSLEVAQISRTLAKYFKLNEDLCETLSLAHDLGHTPFGHAGEEALNDCMKGGGGFDHNIQTIRIVTLLENKYYNFNGLNLTIETLDGLIKHNGPVYNLSKINNILGKNFFKKKIKFENNPSLEAQIASISDDIAYNSHDLEDGLRAKLFGLNDLKKIPVLSSILKKHDMKFKKFSHDLVLRQIIRDIINEMVKDIIQNTIKNIRKNKVKNINDIYKTKYPIVNFSQKMNLFDASIKKFLREKMYYHKSVLEKTNYGKKIIKGLFKKIKKNPKLYMKINNIKKSNIDRSICDFIAGMTDRFAINLYNKSK